MIMLSPHFSALEASCHDGTPVPESLMGNAIELAEDVLEVVREAAGEPLIVLSWYRHPAYNKRIGGARFSQHMTGKAVDVRTLDVRKVPRLHQIVLDLWGAGKLPKLGGLGRYSQFIHLDTHRLANGRLRRWHGSQGQGSEATAEDEGAAKEWMPG